MNSQDSPSAFWNERDIRKILVLKGDHLGDLMLAAPAVYSIKAAFPKALITLASFSHGESLYSSMGLIANHVLYSSPGLQGYPSNRYFQFIKKMRSEKFDLIVNFRHDFRDILLAQVLGGKVLCTYDHKGTGSLADFKLKPDSDSKYEADNHLDLVSAMGIQKIRLNIPEDKQAEQYIRSKCGNHRWVVLHPFARTQAKQWSFEKFSHLIHLISNAGYRVACVGGNSDRSISEELLGNLQDVENFTGRLPFEKLFSLLKRADAFIGIDSFVAHAAQATKTKGLVIFSGTSKVKKWAPPEFLVAGNTVECAPCGLEQCKIPEHPCLAEISVENVMEKFLRLTGGE